MLYKVEDEFLQLILDEVKQSTKSEPLTLMFDGAIISCTSETQKHEIIISLAKSCHPIGMTCKISDWGL